MANINKKALAAIWNKVKFFTDKNNPSMVYVEYPTMNNTVEFVSINDQNFTRYLVCEYCTQVNDESYPDLLPYIKVKECMAIYQKLNPVIIAHRIYGSITGGQIAYDLSDSKARIFCIVKTERKIAKPKYVKFPRNKLERAQVEPSFDNTKSLFELLRPFINLSDEEFKLFVVMLVQAFSRSSSHFAVIISAGRGTGKTTLTRLFRRIVDPTFSEASILPKNEDDLKVSLSKTYVASFDNTSKLSNQYSDLLCAAITGSQAVKRKLYTDSDTVVLNLHNIIIINGIDVVPDRDDLLERSLLFSPLNISPEKRKTDNKFWESFETQLPSIEGAIVDTLQKAMSILPSLEVENLHRMADANREMVAVAVALGLDKDEFQHILLENNQKLQEHFSEDSPVVEAVSEFMNGPMKGKKHLVSESSAAYMSIKRNYSGSPNLLPKSASLFSRELRRQDSALKAAGFMFWSEKRENANFTHIERLSKGKKP